MSYTAPESASKSERTGRLDLRIPLLHQPARHVAEVNGPDDPLRSGQSH